MTTTCPVLYRGGYLYFNESRRRRSGGGPYSPDRDLLSPGWTEGEASVWVATQVRNLSATSPSVSTLTYRASFTI